MRALFNRRFGLLTKDQVTSFLDKGFLVLPNFVARKEIDLLEARASELISKWEPPVHAKVFSTVEQNRQNNDYFMKSSENISFFLEEDAQDETGRLMKAKALCVNKIGHAMHDIDPVFEKLSYRPEYLKMLTNLGYKNPIIVQSMYIMKPPKFGGVVVPHQDCSYIISSPPSCIGIWLAVQDAKRGNACLYAVPGSHKQGTLKHWVKKGDQMVLTNEEKYSTEGGECLEVEKGTVVLLHGNLVHWSEKNLSDTSRHAYTLHIVESNNCKWSEDNWLQRSPRFPFKQWRT